MTTFIDLGRAVLCLDCQAIFTLTTARCPRCAGGAFASLARWLRAGEVGR